MGRMYTLDKKLLCGSPEIRIGKKLYPVDDRKKTVRKALKLFEDKEQGDNFDKADELFILAFGPEAAAEIEKMELSFAAYTELSSLVLAAMTGEDPDKKKEPEEVPEEESFQD